LTDQEILDRIGGPESERVLTNLTRKFNQFLRSLEQREREVLIDALKSSDVAAAQASTLGEDITADRLERLMGAYTSPGDTMIICCGCLYRPPEPPSKK